jgi:hypothetical protein
LETEEEERMQEVKNAAVPYNNVGLLEVRWTPLAGNCFFFRVGCEGSDGQSLFALSGQLSV